MRWRTKKYFVDAWLKDSCFVRWLSKVKNDISKARCTVCRKPFNYQQLGDLLLQIMLKGKKHGNLGAEIKIFFISKSSEVFSNAKVSDDNQWTLENSLSELF